jgi:hypothetical protein
VSIGKDWEYLVKLERQYLQGNISDNTSINSFNIILSLRLGLLGYIAVMECNNFQPLGPQNLVFILFCSFCITKYVEKNINML